MKRIFLSAIALFISFIAFNQNYSRVKVYANAFELDRLSQHGVAVDHGIRKEGVFFISDFSKREIEIMQEQEYKYDILIEDVEAYYVDLLKDKSPSQELKNATCSSAGGGSGGYSAPVTPTNFNLGTMGGYLKYTEMLAELDAMVAQYPNLITAKAPISTFLTIENRPIYHVKISDNPNSNEAEPKILYTAIHHAREPMSLMETIFFMWYVLENYNTSAEIAYLVNNTQMFFVPCINPDGYIYNETTNPNGGGMWRKNRRNNGGGVYGVDLNRNYSYGWGTTGTSTVTSNDTYCGTSAFSEPETQAMRWLVQNNDFEMAFNAHTYAKDILFPIGTTVAEFAPHHNYFQAHTDHMVEHNGYTSMKSSALYPASGDSDDYMYKVDIGVGQKDTIFVHTPEVGTAFWQPQSEIIATCQEMVFPNLILAHLSKNYTIVKDTDPNMISTLSGNFNHSARRLGREAGPVTVSIQPLLNIATVGTAVVYNLAQMQTSTGAISYTLNPAIQFGDQIKYILKTDNGLWVKKDTIIKTYGSLTVQAIEDATTVTNWTGTWSTTTSTFVSASKSFTDSPTGNYASNANKTYTYIPTIDLTNAAAAMISYYAKWAIEADYDYTQFQVSVDGGTTWIGQCGNYTVNGTNANGSVQPNNQPVYEGTQGTWVLEEINLSDYIGQVIKVRFVLKSDGGTNMDGFYFDDFKVMNNIAQAPVAPVASFSLSSSTICQGTAITFNDLSSNNPTTWSWDFGDNNTSNFQNPNYSYTASGNYVVVLTVTNAAGTSNYSMNITVQAPPVVSISSGVSSNLVCVTDATVQLTSNQVGTIFSGVAVTGDQFYPGVAGIGQFSITGTFTDVNGCIGTGFITMTVQACASIDNLSYQGVKVSPNPNNGSFDISGMEINQEIEVYDLNGKLILRTFANATTVTIDLPLVRTGIYYLRTTKNGKVGQLKFAVI